MRNYFANISNASVLDENYARWKDDPLSVDPAFSAFFEGFELGSAGKTNGASVPPILAPTTTAGTTTGAAGRFAGLPLETRVEAFVYTYRVLGHTLAKLDPLGSPRPEQPLLELSDFGFTDAEMDVEVSSKFFENNQKVKLGELIAQIREVYSSDIGYEYMHIQNEPVREWIRARIEDRLPDAKVPASEKVEMLRQLLEAEEFEHFLHTKYVGQKRFSLEGGESLMVALNAILYDCQPRGVEEIVLGMAHRGRLNVLANFVKKSFRNLFAEFSENYVPELVGGDGDVKYHLGYQKLRKLKTGYEIDIRLSPNPSHLEAVNPVVEGMARARQRIRQDTETRTRVLPLLIHGDAAFAGQGLVTETLNLSHLKGYTTGGTIHLIVNNQIGFTTLPSDARSTPYCSDVAKMVEAPIFHVNGDDPVAVAFVAKLALEYRQEFHNDVVIDMYCYRRHGHNEGDEPVFTQPDLYAKIQQQPSVAKLFRQRLIESGELSEEGAKKLGQEFENQLSDALEKVKKAEKDLTLNKFSGSSAVFQPPFSFEPVKTSVSKEAIEAVIKAMTTTPEGFNVFPKLKKTVLERRANALAKNTGFDWATGEALAFGTLLLEGRHVRLSGQDCRRGTFSQRHAVVYDAKTSEPYISLNHIAPEQGKFCVYNSLLSEAAVLGFDYGYSLDFPDMLCLWEAQFGDFANGAQVIIDQFIASSESKWQRPSSIVMLLPHGYEGQGPEHSSARMERFLQLCAEENMQVCNLTTSAQYFHVLRRQLLRPFRKPLIITTPKSMLRLEAAASKVEDFTDGTFQEILPGPLLDAPEKVKRVIFCSGKVYYDLLKLQTDEQIKSATIIRIEQLYPLHEQAIRDAVAPFIKANKFVWCQEESQNMGAWMHLQWTLRQMFGKQLYYAGRDASASPAVGSLNIHKREQKLIIEDAFNL
jgi:2-oxoglutarate dehydrogenase E1 component